MFSFIKNIFKKNNHVVEKDDSSQKMEAWNVQLTFAQKSQHQINSQYHINSKSQIFSNTSSKIETLYKFPITFNNDKLRFHLKVWLYQNDITPAKFKEMFIVDDYANLSLWFRNIDDANNFQKWWDDYKSKYFASEQEMNEYPFSMPREGKLEGYVCVVDYKDYSIIYDPFNVTSSNPSANGTYEAELFCLYTRMHVDWLWIISNTQGAVSIENGWLFSNEEDVVLFKLMQQQ
jgi:hypothetical protein